MAAALSMKSPEAFRTISEVATMLDVPQHVLRFWETRFGQIRPVKRAGGRRFYRPEDVDLLRGIRSLLYFEGYTIKGVQKILREKGARYVTEIGRNAAKPHGPRLVSRAEMEEVAYEASMSVAAELAPPEQDPRSFGALAALARVHADIADALGEARRGRLEELLTDLLALKSRLGAARASARI
jgi:DNA-binding transcriptional MerR regulator